MYPSKRVHVASFSRILLADDQAIFRAGIARVLSEHEEISVLSQCGDAESLLDLVASTRSCVLILAQSLNADMDRILAAAHAVATRVILRIFGGLLRLPQIARAKSNSVSRKRRL